MSSDSAAPAILPLDCGGLPVPPDEKGEGWRLDASSINDISARVVPGTPGIPGVADWYAWLSIESGGGGGRISFQATSGTTPQLALDAARELYTLAMLYLVTRIRAGGALAREVTRQELADPCPAALPFEPRESDTSPADASFFREERA